MVFTIKKGKHYSNNLFHKICNLLNFNKSVSYLVKFDESCTYSLPKEDQGDINKLFGTSIGLHHKNSVRFGWCWLNNKLKLYAYWYDGGVRKSKEIQNIEINKKYFLTIENLDTQWKFVVIGFTDDSKKELIVEKSKTKINFGYRLWPYFGGNQMAPHDVNIEMIDFNE